MNKKLVEKHLKQAIYSAKTVRFIIEPFIEFRKRFPFVVKKVTLRDTNFLRALNFLNKSSKCILKRGLYTCQSFIIEKPCKNFDLESIKDKCTYQRIFTKQFTFVEVEIFPALRELLFNTKLLWCYVNEESSFYGLQDPILFNSNGCPLAWSITHERLVFIKKESNVEVFEG